MSEKTTQQIIGENVEKYYLEKGYKSLTSFASQVGLDTIRVRLIFKGEYKLYVEKIETIAKELDVKVIDLVEDWSE